MPGTVLSVDISWHFRILDSIYGKDITKGRIAWRLGSVGFEACAKPVHKPLFSGELKFTVACLKAISLDLKSFPVLVSY